MKRGSTILHLKRKNSPNNGLKKENRLQWKRKQSRLLERWCRQFFFLRCAWVNFHCLYIERKNHQLRVLCEFITTFTEKLPHLTKSRMFFHYDNAPIHTSIIVLAKRNELKFKLLLHAHYSPDLALPDFFFQFSGLKKCLHGIR